MKFLSADYQENH